MELDEFCQKFSIAPESEAVSLGGWITELMGKIPEANETVDYDHLHIIIRSVENRRVDEIEVSLKEPLPTAPAIEA